MSPFQLIYLVLILCLIVPFIVIAIYITTRKKVYFTLSLISVVVSFLIAIGIWIFATDPIPTAQSMSPLAIIGIVLFAGAFMILQKKLLNWAHGAHQKRYLRAKK